MTIFNKKVTQSAKNGDIFAQMVMVMGLCEVARNVRSAFGMFRNGSNSDLVKINDCFRNTWYYNSKMNQNTVHTTFSLCDHFKNEALIIIITTNYSFGLKVHLDGYCITWLNIIMTCIDSACFVLYKCIVRVFKEFD